MGDFANVQGGALPSSTSQLNPSRFFPPPDRRQPAYASKNAYVGLNQIVDLCTPLMHGPIFEFGTGQGLLASKLLGRAEPHHLSTFVFLHNFVPVTNRAAGIPLEYPTYIISQRYSSRVPKCLVSPAQLSAGGGGSLIPLELFFTQYLEGTGVELQKSLWDGTGVGRGVFAPDGHVRRRGPEWRYGGRVQEANIARHVIDTWFKYSFVISNSLL